jgi:hypothetical protein
MPAISRRARFRPLLAGALQEPPEVALARILEREAVQNGAIGARQRKGVENADRPRMPVQQLSEVRLAQPSVDAFADLDADDFTGRAGIARSGWRGTPDRIRLHRSADRCGCEAGSPGSRSLAGARGGIPSAEGGRARTSSGSRRRTCLSCDLAGRQGLEPERNCQPRARRTNASQARSQETSMNPALLWNGFAPSLSSKLEKVGDMRPVVNATDTRGTGVGLDQGRRRQREQGDLRLFLSTPRAMSLLWATRRRRVSGILGSCAVGRRWGRS